MAAQSWDHKIDDGSSCSFFYAGVPYWPFQQVWVSYSDRLLHKDYVGGPRTFDKLGIGGIAPSKDFRD